MNARIIRLLIGILIGLALGGVILVLPLPVSSAPTVRYHIMVTTPTDEYAVGTGCSLREAIRADNDDADFGGCVLEFSNIGFGPNTILLPSGTYTLTRTGSGDLDLRRSVIISATGATPPIVTGDSGWADRIFHVLTGTVTINSMTIRGGSGSGNGGEWSTDRTRRWVHHEPWPDRR